MGKTQRKLLVEKQYLSQNFANEFPKKEELTKEQGGKAAYIKMKRTSGGEDRKRSFLSANG